MKFTAIENMRVGYLVGFEDRESNRFIIFDSRDRGFTLYTGRYGNGCNPITGPRARPYIDKLTPEQIALCTAASLLRKDSP